MKHIWRVTLGEMRPSVTLQTLDVIASNAYAAGKRAVENYNGPLNNGKGYIYAPEPIKIEYIGHAV